MYYDGLQMLTFLIFIVFFSNTLTGILLKTVFLSTRLFIYMGLNSWISIINNPLLL